MVASFPEESYPAMDRTMTAASPASLLGFLATVPIPVRARPTSPAGRDARGRLLRESSAAPAGSSRSPNGSTTRTSPWCTPWALPASRPSGGHSASCSSRSDPTPFEDALARWAEAASGRLGPPGQQGDETREPVALDGKAVRGSIGRHEGAVHLLSVMAQR